MQIPEVVDIVLGHISNVDFDHALSPDDQVSLFETTIRYVGGLLSGDYIPLPTCD